MVFLFNIHAEENFGRPVGRELAGHRPVLVLSPAAYNDKVSLAVCCSLSTKAKGDHFEVEVALGKTNSVVLSDQVKSIDWRERKEKFKSKITAAQLKRVRENIKALLSIE